MKEKLNFIQNDLKLLANITYQVEKQITRLNFQIKYRTLKHISDETGTQKKQNKKTMNMT